jgi:hypothetical protein
MFIRIVIQLLSTFEEGPGKATEITFRIAPVKRKVKGISD